MADYTRFTRECSFGQLRPELIRALRDHIQSQKLGNVETDVLMCCETASERKSASRLAFLAGGKADTLVYTAMLVTPQWLIWARSGDLSGMVVSSAKLQDIQVKAFASRLTRDTGLQVSGYIGESKQRVRGYIGLGPEEAARAFCEQVMKAVERARQADQSRKPRPRLRWW